MSRAVTRCDNLRLIGRAYRCAARWLRGGGGRASQGASITMDDPRRSRVDSRVFPELAPRYPLCGLLRKRRKGDSRIGTRCARMRRYSRVPRGFMDKGS